MGIKKEITSDKNPTLLRYNSSKGVFILICFLFFSIFFIIWAWYNKEVLFRVLSPLYIMLLISFNLYVYYFLKLKFSYKKLISYIILSFFVIFSFFALFIIL